jgi:hypothetical protein
MKAQFLIARLRCRCLCRILKAANKNFRRTQFEGVALPCSIPGKDGPTDYPMLYLWKAPTRDIRRPIASCDVALAVCESLTSKFWEN